VRETSAKRESRRVTRHFMQLVLEGRYKALYQLAGLYRPCRGCPETLRFSGGLLAKARGTTGYHCGVPPALFALP